MKTKYAGSDYGLGLSNVDRVSGMRYGVISAHSLCQDHLWEGALEDVYAVVCPHCINDLDNDCDVGDRLCPHCDKEIDDGEEYGVEPCASLINVEGYEGSYSRDTDDIYLVKSPYYTRAQFCSPCVPGAGNLDCPCSDGPPTYCFGHEWFDGEEAPYPVYDLATGKLVVTPDEVPDYPRNYAE